MDSVTSTPKLFMKVLCIVFAFILIAGGILAVRLSEEEIERAKPIEVKHGVIVNGEYKVLSTEKGFGNPEWQEAAEGGRSLAQVAIVLGVAIGIGGLFIKTKENCTY